MKRFVSLSLVHPSFIGQRAAQEGKPFNPPLSYNRYQRESYEHGYFYEQHSQRNQVLPEQRRERVEG